MCCRYIIFIKIVSALYLEFLKSLNKQIIVLFIF